MSVLVFPRAGRALLQNARGVCRTNRTLLVSGSGEVRLVPVGWRAGGALRDLAGLTLLEVRLHLFRPEPQEAMRCLWLDRAEFAVVRLDGSGACAAVWPGEIQSEPGGDGRVLRLVRPNRGQARAVSAFLRKTWPGVAHGWSALAARGFRPSDAGDAHVIALDFGIALPELWHRMGVGQGNVVPLSPPRAS